MGFLNPVADEPCKLAGSGNEFQSSIRQIKKYG